MLIWYPCARDAQVILASRQRRQITVDRCPRKHGDLPRLWQVISRYRSACSRAASRYIYIVLNPGYYYVFTGSTWIRSWAFLTLSSTVQLSLNRTAKMCTRIHDNTTKCFIAITKIQHYTTNASCTLVAKMHQFNIYISLNNVCHYYYSHSRYVHWKWFQVMQTESIHIHSWVLMNHKIQLGI